MRGVIASDTALWAKTRDENMPTARNAIVRSRWCCMGPSLEMHLSLLHRPRGHGTMEIPAGRSASSILAIAIFVAKSIMRTTATSPAVFDENTANA